MLMASLSSSQLLGRFILKRVPREPQGRCSHLLLLLQNKPLYLMPLIESDGGVITPILNMVLVSKDS